MQCATTKQLLYNPRSQKFTSIFPSQFYSFSCYDLIWSNLSLIWSNLSLILCKCKKEFPSSCFYMWRSSCPNTTCWKDCSFPIEWIWHSCQKSVGHEYYFWILNSVPLIYMLSLYCCCCYVTSVVSDSVWPHRRQPTRLPRPWDSPGKNTGVGCHFLLQCTKVKSESEVSQSCLTLSDPIDCSPPGSSIHGIFQARVPEWGATAFSGPYTSSTLF